MTLNQDKLDELLGDADELITRFVPQDGVPPTWNHNLEILAIYAVINQLWQNPNDKMSVYVQAMQPALLAAFEMGRAAEREGTV